MEKHPLRVRRRGCSLWENFSTASPQAVSKTPAHLCEIANVYSRRPGQVQSDRQQHTRKNSMHFFLDPARRGRQQYYHWPFPCKCLLIPAEYAFLTFPVVQQRPGPLQKFVPSIYLLSAEEIDTRSPPVSPWHLEFGDHPPPSHYESSLCLSFYAAPRHS